MLISSLGEDIPPSRIEPLTGVGLGAFWLPTEKLLFFSNLSNAPDRGISTALRILGFDFDEHSNETPGKPPYDELGEALTKSPAILGPLDMGYLTHNPNHEHQKGADHFVLAHKIEKDEVGFHDPEGFPSVRLPLKQMELAWRAENIPYRRGYYRYWTNPRRVKHRDNYSTYQEAVESFKQAYLESARIGAESKLPIGKAAILALAQHAHDGPVTASQKSFMTQFLFRLGARRALDFVGFFEKQEACLAALKRTQAEFFGNCHILSMYEDWAGLSRELRDLAEVEDKFLESLKDA